VLFLSRVRLSLVSVQLRKENSGEKVSSLFFLFPLHTKRMYTEREREREKERKEARRVCSLVISLVKVCARECA
jgi:hypothetical protein